MFKHKMPQTSLKIGWKTAMALVIANMIGTGAFTSLGFQVMDISNTFSIVLLWILGGIIALSGSFVYAELGAHFQESGGEYLFLSKIYHPFIGYLSGWISLTVGFAAPIALAAMALGTYMKPITGGSSNVIATIVILLLSVIHSFDLKRSSLFQNGTTIYKVVLIITIIMVGLWMPAPIENGLVFDSSWSTDWKNPVFAIALIYVTYSYSGWNAAAYIVEEIDNVKSSLPKALIGGTLLVMILYVFLQFVFLKHIPLAELKGQIDVGHIYAKGVLGEKGGEVISILIATFLLSSISAMIWVGPRVVYKMAGNHRLWSFLQGARSIPTRAIWFQTILSIGMIWTGTFESILLYCGFILMLSSGMTVFGSMVLRYKHKDLDLAFVNPTYPYLPLFFCLVYIWAIFYLISERPFESILGMVNIVVGGLSYILSQKIEK